MRVLVTGSRAWTNQQAVWDALLDAWHDATQNGHSTITVVHGAASGVDTMADQWANAHKPYGVNVDPHAADWDTCAPECPAGHRKTRRDGATYCPTAGHRRNALMVGLGAGVCLAFPYGKASGTKNCMRLAAAAGIPVKEHTP